MMRDDKRIGVGYEIVTTGVSNNKERLRHNYGKVATIFDGDNGIRYAVFHDWRAVVAVKESVELPASLRSFFLAYSEWIKSGSPLIDTGYDGVFRRYRSLSGNMEQYLVNVLGVDGEGMIEANQAMRRIDDKRHFAGLDLAVKIAKEIKSKNGVKHGDTADRQNESKRKTDYVQATVQRRVRTGGEDCAREGAKLAAQLL